MSMDLDEKSRMTYNPLPFWFREKWWYEDRYRDRLEQFGRDGQVNGRGRGTDMAHKSGQVKQPRHRIDAGAVPAQ